MKSNIVRQKLVAFIIIPLSLASVAGALLIAKSVQAVKSMASDSKNIRVSEVTVCTPDTDSVDSPNFSGCSSIL
jgi:hypothetical protein